MSMRFVRSFWFQPSRRVVLFDYHGGTDKRVLKIWFDFNTVLSLDNERQIPSPEFPPPQRSTILTHKNTLLRLSVF